MEYIKSCQKKKSVTFFFSQKKFLKIFAKLILLEKCYVHNIFSQHFIKNPKLHVGIGYYAQVKSNLNYEFKLEPIIIYHL